MFLTVILTIFVKGVANMYALKEKLTHEAKKKLKYKQLDKLFQVFMIGIPAVGMSQVPILNLGQVGIFILAYMLIYFCWMDRFFNRLTGSNIQYVGKTDFVDLLLRRIFKISEGNAKGKNTVTILKWASFIIGLALMLDFIKLAEYVGW
jgi:hypothetical protein